MSGTFTTGTAAGDIFGQSPNSAGTSPTGQRIVPLGGSGPSSYLIELADGSGFIELADGSGQIELADGP